MGVDVECPVCEAQFSVTPTQPGERIQCPGCAHPFAWDQGQSLRKPLPVPGLKGPDSVPRPRSGKQRWRTDPFALEDDNLTAGSSSKLVAPDPSGSIKLDAVPMANPPALPLPAGGPSGPLAIPPAVASDGSPGRNLPAPSVIPQPAPGVASIRRRYQHRNRQRTWITLGVGVLFIVLISGLTTLLVLRLQGIDLSASGADAGPGKEVELFPGLEPIDGLGDRPDLEVKQNATPRQRPEEVPPVRIRHRDLPKQTLEFLSQKDLDTAWRSAQPRLVSLSIKSPTATRDAIGTIVDSRGWVLTSLDAIAGASSIQVTVAAKTIDDVYDQQQLTDEVRGVIATDPANNLALLSINRRFVISFGGMDYAPRRELVVGQYLVRTSPPTVTEPYGSREVEVKGRYEFADLPDLARAAAEKRQLNNPNLIWLAIAGGPDNTPGVSLWDAAGRLAAVEVFSVADRSYFLLADGAVSLIEGARDEPQPLASIASESQRQILDNTLSATNPMRAVSDQLNRQGQTCEDFGWIPVVEGDFEQLAQFGDAMSKALRYTLTEKDNPVEKEDVRRLTVQIEKWRDSLTAALSKPGTQPLQQLGALNEWAVAALRADSAPEARRQVPFFGRVYLAGIVSPDPDSMFLAVGDDLAFVKVPFEVNGDAMLPDSKWIFFVERPPTREVTRHVYGKAEFESQPAVLQFAIGPLK